MANKIDESLEISEEEKKSMEQLMTDKNVTDEEFKNFMQRVIEVEKIVKKLASNDASEQESGQIMADAILTGAKNNDKKKNEINENDELITKSSRTVINKYEKEFKKDPNEMSKESFMKSIEKDANERAEDRKIRNERAETYKKIGNSAFNKFDYEKAVSYYGKAIEQRKDSTVVWNNRAIAYIKLGLYEKALDDCEWALRVSKSNIKALLNSAKCHAYLGNDDKRDEFIQLAKSRVPEFIKYIEDFEKTLKNNPINGEKFQEDEESLII
ncbi:hypothetical protein HCN44_006749 [Aphidius gifuensis]|uniref:Tetratricopeptide repeat protein 12 n=1 Tax=Aphidius gifuensis TaxID=684658 RepID=A0A835CTR4_APHGI|nr:tetratricopeptide repeat protein 12-like [Aphidius gifuensis]KAF7995642.1 hypothetical protein HCN44_006749 [Aphidius gifuensis]